MREIILNATDEHGRDPEYKPERPAKCKKCGWRGEEGQLTRHVLILSAVATAIYYCPLCHWSVKKGKWNR